MCFFSTLTLSPGAPYTKQKKKKRKMLWFTQFCFSLAEIRQKMIFFPTNGCVWWWHIRPGNEGLVFPFNIFKFNMSSTVGHPMSDAVWCWFNVSFVSRCEKYCRIRLAISYSTVLDDKQNNVKNSWKPTNWCLYKVTTSKKNEFTLRAVPRLGPDETCLRAR